MTLRDIVKILTKRTFPLFRKSIKTVTINGMKLKYVYVDKSTPYIIVFERVSDAFILGQNRYGLIQAIWSCMIVQK